MGSASLLRITTRIVKKPWSKHKKLCKVLRDKSSFLIPSMKRSGFHGSVNVHRKGLDKVGPNYSSPPPRDGKRFIVKVQTNFESEAHGDNAHIINTLYHFNILPVCHWLENCMTGVTPQSKFKISSN